MPKNAFAQALPAAPGRGCPAVTGLTLAEAHWGRRKILEGALRKPC